MPIEFAKIGLLERLYKLRRERRRFLASFITTYSINLPFYESVVLRHLEAAGSRLNVVLVDAHELAKSFVDESTRPQRAGLDYVLLPVRTGGAFHPKVTALFSDDGMAVAVGSHNLTEAGYGRNAEISVTFGFDGQLAPLNIARPIADYLLQCAGELAPGDATLSRRLAERLVSYSMRGNDPDENVAFVGARPGGSLLLDDAFKRPELVSARRVLVLGPYFDDDLGFLAELHKRAPQAEFRVAIQPNHAVMKRPGHLPTRMRFCNADAIALRRPPPFIHAKAIVVEGGGQTIAAIGSANPSRPAWFENGKYGNFEAMVIIRSDDAKRVVRALALDQLWNSPAISKAQLQEIERRSQLSSNDEGTASIVTVPGLWRDGWVEAQLQGNVQKINAITKWTVSGSSVLNLETRISGGKIGFAAPEPGMFSVELAGRKGQTVVVASSAGELSRVLIAGSTARLIDELGRLSDGTAPGEELLNLCEKVLLEPEEANRTATHRPSQRSSDKNKEVEGENYGPRGISINDGRGRSRRAVTISLDISAIITLLLKDLEGPKKENSDPTVENHDEGEGGGSEDEELRPASTPHWEDVVRAVRPRVSRLLNRLRARLEEPHSAKWKYERVLVTLALLKRLRKFHPGASIPFSAIPERIVDEDQLRDAFKLAMRCWFARASGAVGALERLGGLDREYEIMGRALLLWIAYESGADIVQPASSRMEPDEFRACQADRTDALISAIAASASQETLERARREIFDRGEWSELCDRAETIERWFRRHTQIGQAMHNALIHSRPPALPVLLRSPLIQDIVVWKQEPGWPRFPEVVTGRIVHLADVGDEEPIKIAQQFVQPIDADRLGISALLAPPRSR